VLTVIDESLRDVSARNPANATDSSMILAGSVPAPHPDCFAIRPLPVKKRGEVKECSLSDSRRHRSRQPSLWDGYRVWTIAAHDINGAVEQIRDVLLESHIVEYRNMRLGSISTIDVDVAARPILVPRHRDRTSDAARPRAQGLSDVQVQGLQVFSCRNLAWQAAFGEAA